MLRASSICQLPCLFHVFSFSWSYGIVLYEIFTIGKIACHVLLTVVVLRLYLSFTCSVLHF